MKAKYIDEVVPCQVNQITPTVHWFKDVTDWASIIPEPTVADLHYVKKGKKSYHLVTYHCGFDTEFYTKTEYKKNKIVSARGYMYIWQFAINDHVILGRTWDEFTTFLSILSTQCNTGRDRRIRIWVANLGCEFQYMRKYLEVDNLFARKQRQPIYVETTKGIIFQDCLTITGGSLKSLAKDFCKTQKMAGDLDYSIPRNNTTKLDSKELQYVINDVVILSEFDQYMVGTYLKQGFDIPLTKTAILRKSVKKRFMEQFSNGRFPNRAKLDLYVKCFPPTAEEYNTLMNMVYRGGYTHSNIANTGVILHGVNGVDFTSSYPAVMLQCQYPVTPFVTAACPNEQYLETHFKSEAWYACFRFKNIRRTTTHSVESASKTYEYKQNNGSMAKLRELYNLKVDNGRVVSADQMTVWLTDLDWETYKKFYTWDEVEIRCLHWAKYGQLPDYVKEPLMKAYENKARIKKQLKQMEDQGLKDTPKYAELNAAYAIAKAMVNAAYGMMCQKLNLTEVHYENNHWSEDLSGKDYYETLGVDHDDYLGMITKQKSPFPKTFLLPQWGVWVCAHARKRLLDMVWTIGEDVVYCDTDSIYMRNYSKHEHEIAAWNDHIHAWNRANLPALFETLGDFDKLSEDDYDRFKTLGAKRYLKSHGDHTEVTIAGLPKGTLEAAAEAAGMDIYEFFNDEMYVSMELSTKNAHKYNDDPHGDYIDGVYMQEQSSLGIYATSFTMSLDDLYAASIQDIIDETSRKDFEENP